MEKPMNERNENHHGDHELAHPVHAVRRISPPHSMRQLFVIAPWVPTKGRRSQPRGTSVSEVRRYQHDHPVQ